MIQRSPQRTRKKGKGKLHKLKPKKKKKTYDMLYYSSLELEPSEKINPSYGFWICR